MGVTVRGVALSGGWRMADLATKFCPICEQSKPVSEFNRNRTRKDGLQHACRPCQNQRRAEDERRNPRAPLRGKRRSIEAIASEKVRRAVRDGRLVKPDACENCGATGTLLHGHHDDYSKPLDVIWLCPTCHADRHADRRDALDALIEQAAKAEAAERERDELKALLADIDDDDDTNQKERIAAEREVERLRAALLWAIDEPNLGALIPDRAAYEWWQRQIRARAALGTKEGT